MRDGAARTANNARNEPCSARHLAVHAPSCGSRAPPRARRLVDSRYGGARNLLTAPQTLAALPASGRVRPGPVSRPATAGVADVVTGDNETGTILRDTRHEQVGCGRGASSNSSGRRARASLLSFAETEAKNQIRNFLNLGKARCYSACKSAPLSRGIGVKNCTPNNRKVSQDRLVQTISEFATARVSRSGRKSLALSIERISVSLLLARFIRLLMVPTAHPQI